MVVSEALTELEVMLSTGRDEGCPEDQMSNFAKGGYVCLPGMFAFHAYCRLADNKPGPQWIALGGKRGPGKSHTVMAQVGLDDCQRVPGLKVLYLRKVMKTAAESLEDLAIRVFRYVDHSTSSGTISFPNGSRILLGGYNNERDIEKYLGIEYDAIVIEEATQITESKKDKLRGSLRTSKQGWRPRIYMTTNADGVGLAWFKQMFIIPWRKKVETITRFVDVNEIVNPFIDEGYNEWLATLTGPLGKAWKEGDWDAFAGMAFPMWDLDQHEIKEFEIPEHWVRWRAIDWGFASPFCCLWFARDPDTRRVYIYHELYRAGLTDRQQAERIVDQTPATDTIKITYADPSMWEKKTRDNDVYSTADEYRKYGVPLTRADNDRIQGKRKVNNILSLAVDGKPGLQIFEHCTHIIEQLSTLACDEDNPEDVDTDQEDHAYDPLRYGLTNEKKTEDKPGKKAGRNPLEEAGL